MKNSNYDPISENAIEITKYSIKGELQNLLEFEDGTPVRCAEDWQKRREEVYRYAVELQYGKMPPAPKSVKVEPLYLGGNKKLSSYRVTCDTEGKAVCFIMYMFKADTREKAPAVISGDLCFPYAFDKEYLDTFIENGINFVAFNRCELAPDIATYNFDSLYADSGENTLAREIYYRDIANKNCGGQLKAAYPDYNFGAIGAWAWGYSRCVDALEILGNVDLSIISFTGHSRGGKTALLAGALDTRAAIVNPNASCSGGCGSYKISIEAINENRERRKSEPLSNIHLNFPAWLGEEMESYIGREEDLPFDAHYIKAMVAPRVLFISEGAADIHSNPVGNMQTTEAVAEVYKLLKFEENLVWYFRHGDHGQKVEDIEQLVAVIDRQRYGYPLNDKFYRYPYKRPINI